MTPSEPIHHIPRTLSSAGEDLVSNVRRRKSHTICQIGAEQQLEAGHAD